MVKSGDSKLKSEEQDDSKDLTEVIDDAASEETEEEEISKPRLPKWAKILLMILPAAIFITTIVLVDHFYPFPDSVSPNAVIALTGIGLLGFVVISDMLYRNLFVSRMLRRETKKSKIYKEILKDKKETKKEKTRFDELDEDYSYDEEEDEEFVDELESQEEFDEIDDEEYEEEEEYQYDSEDDDDSKYYRTRSLAIRGGIFSILIVNSLIILAAAVILQIALYGGFGTPTGA